MPFAELSAVKHRLQLGVPLPFNVRDADHTLLLARGITIANEEQLDALMSRGALVDMAELMTVSDQIRQAPRQQLPKLWQVATSQLNRTLLSAGSADAATFRQALGDASAPLQTLVERDPDLAIFQVMRQGANADSDYGAGRSLQTAVTSLLVAQRLGWESDECERAFKVALTMNLAMLELQGQLARQAFPPTPEQRKDLQMHPMRGVRMLEAAGISDPLWLRAVLEHHENETGTGYPSGRSEPCELSSLVRRSDLYTSKLASRGSRDALAADMAGRQMFMQDPGHPMTAALVKEFGIYPPGCHVRLATGELAVVVARGPTITTPVVACLTNARGAALPLPMRRDTTDRANAIVAVVGEKSSGVRCPIDRLLAVLVA